ncbi:MAG: DUF3786 domain-containing protein [Nitrospirae bacterium]|nr:DUF3786 domain-containing protein [Nitrospirota bacterium]
MKTGEDKSWALLAEADPSVICRNAQATYDAASKTYTLRCFSADIKVHVAGTEISGSDQHGELLLTRLGYFSRLSILCYLNCSKDLPLSEKLINPVNLKGGLLFFRGSHVLPLDRLAEKYDKDPDGFINKGTELGGEAVKYGDAAIRFFPLPSIPVVLILWRGDDEFPPRADLLFDSTAERHLALDVLWSIAMMSVLIMM